MTVIPWSSLEVGESFSVPNRVPRHVIGQLVRQANVVLRPRQYHYARADDLADWAVTRLEDSA